MRPRFMVLFLLLAPTAASAQAVTDPMGWLTGCWRMSRDNTVVEERWSDMQGGMMLGTSRTVRGGRVVEFEFARVSLISDTLAFHAMPNGQTATPFNAVARSADSVVFVNPQNDFPRMVTYKRAGADSVHAWIEGSGRRFDFLYARMTC